MKNLQNCWLAATKTITTTTTTTPGRLTPVTGSNTGVSDTRMGHPETQGFMSVPSKTWIRLVSVRSPSLWCKSLVSSLYIVQCRLRVGCGQTAGVVMVCARVGTAGTREKESTYFFFMYPVATELPVRLVYAMKSTCGTRQLVARLQEIFEPRNALYSL